MDCALRIVGVRQKVPGVSYNILSTVGMFENVDNEIKGENPQRNKVYM